MAASQPWVATCSNDGLARHDGEGSIVDLGLEHAHRAVEEDSGVVVIRRTGEQLDVPLVLVALALGEAVQQGLALQFADLEVVEREVVVDGLGVQDEAVVRDDDRAGLVSGLDLGRELRAVLGADDDDLGAVGDHRGDLVLLLGDRVAGRGVLDVGLVAGILETVGEQVAREHPVLRGLVGQCDADDRAGLEAALAARCRAVSVRAEQPASASAADVATTIVANAILRMCISFYLLVVMGGS